MKKYALALFILFYASGFAQLRPGVVGGINFSNFANTFDGSSNTHTAFALGIYFEQRDFDVAVFHPELLFSMKGASYSAFVDGMKVNTEVQCNYFEVPLLLKLRIPTESAISPHLLFGPALGILLNSTMRVDKDSVLIEKGTDNLKTLDLGLILSGGFAFPCGRGEMNVDLRYEIGFTAIDNSALGSDIKNSLVSLMLGYSF